ncbi:MAG: O-methyltransferase [Candidatus Bathyarchaeia archaeon]
MKKSANVLRAIEKASEKRYLPIIGSERGKILAEIVRAAKPKRVLEVGCLVGYSTILIAEELEADAEIVTIEIDRDEAEIAEQNLRDAGVKPRVQILVGDASELIPKLNGMFDLVFLDEDKHEYFRHIQLIEDKLHKGSIVIADNAGAYAFSMRNYLHYVRNSGKYKSQFITAGTDGLEVSIKL